jgi:hypothetical protein
LIPFSIDCGRVIVFLKSRPSNIDTGIPDIGDADPEMPCNVKRHCPKYSADINPNCITVAEAKSPGTTEANLELLGFSDLFCGRVILSLHERAPSLS